MLGIAALTQIDATKTMCAIDDKNQIEEQFISSQTFHRTPGGHIRKITVGERFEPRILESFDLATQELYQPPPCKDPHQNPQEKLHRGRGDRMHYMNEQLVLCSQTRRRAFWQRTRRKKTNRKSSREGVTLGSALQSHMGELTGRLAHAEMKNSVARLKLRDESVV
jgi:hypothetical protein